MSKATLARSMYGRPSLSASSTTSSFVASPGVIHYMPPKTTRASRGERSVYISRSERGVMLTCLPCEPSSDQQSQNRSNDKAMKTRAFSSSLQMMQSHKCKSTCQEGKECIQHATFAENLALLEDFWGKVTSYQQTY